MVSCEAAECLLRSLSSGDTTLRGYAKHPLGGSFPGGQQQFKQLILECEGDSGIFREQISSLSVQRGTDGKVTSL